MAQEPTNTRYEEVAKRLLKDIEDGLYVVGSLLPTENELSAQFGVSRQTVRAALALLQERGYISRKKAVGSRVESVNPDTFYRQTFGSIAEVVRVASELEVRSLQSVERVSFERATARRLTAPLGGDWIRFSGSRLVPKQGNRIVSWQNIFVDASFETITPIVHAHPDQLITTILERECGVAIAEIRQTITVTALPEVAAIALDAKAGAPGVSIVRHFRDRNGKILEISETVYPGDRISISTRLRKSKSPS